MDDLPFPKNTKPLYFLLRNGQQYGPYTIEKLKEGIHLGRLYFGDRVRADTEEVTQTLSVILEAASGWPEGPVQYASAVHRCIAYIIDFILCGIIYIFLLIPPAIINYLLLSDATAFTVSLAIYSNALALYVLIAYFVWGLCSGSTIGMKILHIRSITLTGVPLGFGRSLANFILFYFSGGLTFLALPFTERKQGIHDLITGVIIIRNDK